MNKKLLYIFIVIIILVIGIVAVFNILNRDTEISKGEPDIEDNQEDTNYEDYLDKMNGGSDKGEGLAIIDKEDEDDLDKDNTEEETTDEEEGSEDSKNNDSDLTEVTEGDNTLVMSKSRNTSIVVENKTSNEVTFSEVEENNNSNVGRPNLVDVGNGKNSSNGVDTSNLKDNKYSEAVKDIYKEKLNLKVIPIDGGFGVFNDKLKNSYSSKDRIFIYSSFPEYDDLTVEVMLELDFDLTEKQIRNAINETRKTGEFVSVGKYEFKHGGETSSVRW